MGSIMINNEMFGCDVIANPTLLPGEEPTPITEIQINGSKYSIEGGGGGVPGIGYTLFKDGEFYNQDVVSLNITPYEIVDGKIKLIGTGTKGVCVNQCTLDTNYLFIVKYKCTITNPYCQGGRSSLGSNVPAIVEQGTGRISYTNFQSISNLSYTESTLSQNANNSEGAFLSLGSYDDSFIEEISVIPCDASVVAN